jgi:hypothetical protein
MDKQVVGWPEPAAVVMRNEWIRSRAAIFFSASRLIINLVLFFEFSGEQTGEPEISPLKKNPVPSKVVNYNHKSVFSPAWFDKLAAQAKPWGTTAQRPGLYP